MKEGKSPIRLLLRPQLKVKIETKLEVEAEPKIMRGVSPLRLNLRLEEIKFLVRR